jgi:hypothetical protein
VEDERQGLITNHKEGNDRQATRQKNALSLLMLVIRKSPYTSQLKLHSHRKDLLCCDGTNCCNTSKNSQRPNRLPIDLRLVQPLVMETQPQSVVTLVQSCDASTSCSLTPTKLSCNNLVAIPNGVAASQSARKDEETKDRQRDALRQAIFEKASNDALEIPNGYLKVAVKIIRWDESIDDFSEGHTSEVSINPTSSLATCDHVPNLVYRLSG